MNKKLMNEFANPGSKYRGAPFWAWNGKLDPEELRRQIRIMHRMGLGGFFMHSRVGLDTAYLSDEWFENVKACIDEAEKLDMQAWLYDEDRWPSGAAGGLVTNNPAHRMRMLVMEEFTDIKKFNKARKSRYPTPVSDEPVRPVGKDQDRPEKKNMGVFTARIKNNTLENVKKQTGQVTLRPGETVLYFYEITSACSSWYNGFTYLDTLSHDAVKAFIKTTHDAYLKKIGKEFGKRVPGIFTDEPNFAPVCHPVTETMMSSPWTGKLAATFKKRYGYDLLARLPELFYYPADESASPVKYHYMDCVTHLFTDAFARQIGDWCAKNGLQHTGHVLLEDSLRSQTSRVGSSLRFYEHMQAPGMDLLTEHARQYDTAKQVSSVANQTGAKWRLTETYGCTGWDFPFMGHKALGDWQAAQGINLRCQHLSWYTMEGEAKRDYPAGIFYQSPWWEHYRKVEDYFARVNRAVSAGAEVRDVLVVHPVESMWLEIGRGWFARKGAQALDRMIIALRDTLLEAHVDFDYGDEDMLSRLASVKKSPAGTELKVGKARYTTVVVPALKTIRSTTVALLEKFRKAGGRVIFAGPVSPNVDAAAAPAARALARKCLRTPARGAALAAALAPARRLSITGPDGNEIEPVMYQLRQDKGHFYLFMCNTGNDRHDSTLREPKMVRDRTARFPDVRIDGFAGCTGTPAEVDLDTGTVYRAESRKVAGGIRILTSLPALGSRLFIIPKKKGGASLPARPLRRQVRKSILNRKTWDIALSEDNVLVLDRPEIRLGGKGAWRKPADVLFADQLVRGALGVPVRGGRMTQPWARDKNKKKKSLRVTLRYSLAIDRVPAEAVWLAVEKPETFTITVNGSGIDTDTAGGWWCDRSLKKLRIDSSLLKKGENTILLDCSAYTEDHPGLEIVYLLGRFGVKRKKADLTLTVPVTGLKTGDWTGQGLPFYSGNLGYCTTVKAELKKNQRLLVRIPSYRGVAVRVSVDGQDAGVIAWEPNEVDITDLVTAGKPADLRIDILGHRRNSHGPFHMAAKWPSWTGPIQYREKDTPYRDDYNLVPCGMMQAPELVWVK